MEGELELEWQGRDITLRRGPRGNVPFGSFSAVYTGTREPVPELTPTACGELLTGVGAEVFTRSAFLGAGDLAVTAAPELERRIAALVSSGEEDVSFSQAQERLKEWRNRRRVNRSVGEIPRLEGELAQAEARLNQMDEVTRQLARLAEERAELERRQEFLLQCQQAHRRYAAWELSSRYAQAREEYEEARDQLAALEGEQARFGVLPDREALKEAQGELQYLKVLGEEIRQGEEALKQAEERSVQAQAAAQDDLFSQLSGEEAVARIGEECETFRQELRRAERLKKRFLPLQLAGLAALAALPGLRLAWSGTSRCCWRREPEFIWYARRPLCCPSPRGKERGSRRRSSWSGTAWTHQRSSPPWLRTTRSAAGRRSGRNTRSRSSGTPSPSGGTGRRRPGRDCWTLSTGSPRRCGICLAAPPPCPGAWAWSMS